MFLTKQIPVPRQHCSKTTAKVGKTGQKRISNIKRLK
jgi:hypothetical protein